jgi:hypothetical protein
MATPCGWSAPWRVPPVDPCTNGSRWTDQRAFLPFWKLDQLDELDALGRLRLSGKRSRRFDGHYVDTRLSVASNARILRPIFLTASSALCYKT